MSAESVSDTVVTLGIPIQAVSMDEALRRIDGFIEARTPHHVVTPNLDFAVQARSDVELHRILCEADLVLCDGMPLVWASRWLGAALDQRIAGSDLVLALLERAASRGYRVFFLGSTQETLEAARSRCEERFPGIRICGVHSPPYAELLALDRETLRSHVRATRPDLLLVALGPPKQEKLISMISRELGVPCSIGVGASLDFLAGRFPRAPEWMRRSGTEWVFRLLMEPRRLFRRYSRDAAFFFPMVAGQLLQTGRRGKTTVSPSPTPSRGTGSWYTWRGRIDGAALRAGAVEIPAAKDPGDVSVVVLEAVESIDAVGLGVLLQVWKGCRDRGGDLLLYRPSKAVRRALRTLRLDRILRTAHTQQEAEQVMTLRPSRPGIQVAYGAEKRTLVLSLAGELTVRGLAHCRRTLLAEWERHPQAESMGLDVGDLFYIDSAGLALLLEMESVVQRRSGGHLRLLRPSPNVLEVIEHGGAMTLCGHHSS